MTYATVQDLTDRRGEAMIARLTGGDDLGLGVAPTVDPVVAERALADATSEIDGYLRDRYALPLAQVPAQLVEWTCTLAMPRLYTRAADRTAGMPDDLVAEIKAVRAQLDRVSKGTIDLGLPTGEAPASAARPLARVSSPPRLMSPDALKDYDL
jgi:phage gp36-like protein